MFFMSHAMPATPSRLLLRSFLMAGALALVGCSTTGNQFDTTDLRFLVPGETTLPEAVALLQGEPVNVYRQLDGSAMARWAHTATLATDAVYFNQELWLAFDAYGRFDRIVKSNNIPHVNLYQDGRRIDVPLQQPAMPAYATSYAPVAPVAHEAVPRPVTESPISQPAVSYSLNR